MTAVRISSATAAAAALAVLTLDSALVAQAPGASPASEAATARSVALVQPPVLPRAISSFGAARSGGWVYVFGGHIGRAHAHSRDNVVGSFRRLNLADGSSWEELPSGPALQGTTLVSAPDGRLFRVGGLSAKNAPGEEDDLVSVASVQSFDPTSPSAWRDETPLPEARSSHDAFVVGNKLYVVGGWDLRGKDDDEVWHETAWVADLAVEPLTWRPIAKPTSLRRALAVAAFGARVAVVGGLTEDGDMTRQVAVYDPASDAWVDAPDLPGPAFGSAAIGIGDALYATAMDGRLFALAPDLAAWRLVTQLAMPRFFHRLVPAADGQLLALGGAGRGGHMRSCEFVALTAPKMLQLHAWELPFAGATTHRHGIRVQDNVVHLIGGNRGTSRERFAADQFVTETWKVNLAQLTVTRGHDLPAGRQSMAVTTVGRRGRTTVAFGGIGPDVAGEADGAVEAAVSRADGFALAGRGGEVTPVTNVLPTPRTQFQTIEHDGQVWVFGGIDFQPQPGGRGSATYPKDLLVADASSQPLRFASANVELPRPRRSFGAAKVGSKVYLIGGLGEGFNAAEGLDVFDLETKTWSELPSPPTAWVSPQVCAIEGRIYVACGGTMRGQRFTEDRSLVVFDPSTGTWATLVDELPFRARHTQMTALRDRLLFSTANDERRDRIRLFVLDPVFGDAVVERSFH